MYVRDAMLDHSVTVRPDEGFRALLRHLLGSRQATAAVLDEDRRLLGIVGLHDVLRKIVPLYVDLDDKLMEVMHDGYFEERLARLQDLQVADFMTEALDCVGPDDTVIKAVVIIVEHCRKTLPVIEDGRFLGMITRRSIVEKVGSSLLEDTP